MLQHFKMNRAFCYSNNVKGFENLHGYQINYIRDGYKSVRIDAPSVVAIDDPTWLSNVNDTCQIYNVIQVSNAEFKRLVNHWYYFYKRHRLLYHKSYQRASELYQYYHIQKHRYK